MACNLISWVSFSIPYFILHLRCYIPHSLDALECNTVPSVDQSEARRHFKFEVTRPEHSSASLPACVCTPHGQD